MTMTSRTNIAPPQMGQPQISLARMLATGRSYETHYYGRVIAMIRRNARNRPTGHIDLIDVNDRAVASFDASTRDTQYIVLAAPPADDIPPHPSERTSVVITAEVEREVDWQNIKLVASELRDEGIAVVLWAAFINGALYATGQMHCWLTNEVMSEIFAEVTGEEYRNARFLYSGLRSKLPE